MSPEQLQGKEVDTRSDIFAFGCVLYEMLSGKRAFDGSSSAANTIASILEREPAPLSVRPPLFHLIQTCLAKEPDQRFQTCIDLKRALIGQPGLAAKSLSMLRPHGRGSGPRSRAVLR